MLRSTLVRDRLLVEALVHAFVLIVAYVIEAVTLSAVLAPNRNW